MERLPVSALRSTPKVTPEVEFTLSALKTEPLFKNKTPRKAPVAFRVRSPLILLLSAAEILSTRILAFVASPSVSAPAEILLSSCALIVRSPAVLPSPIDPPSETVTLIVPAPAIICPLVCMSRSLALTVRLFPDVESTCPLLITRSPLPSAF